jgi:predicted metalloprotease
VGAPVHGRGLTLRTEIHTPCGVQTAEVGPFYCPPAKGVYLNTDFFTALSRAYDLRGGFAAAYVTAHEVGHHIQQLFGLHQRIAELDQSDPDGSSRRSIALELQADCYAGVWLHELQGAGQLSEDDINDIVKAAAVVGDDYQRNRAGADLAPETWTHGSSQQRVHWLGVGMQSGAPAACDTFTTTE